MPGNPGYAKIQFIGERVTALSERWFEICDNALNDKLNDDWKRLAFQELGKLISKSMPQPGDSEDNPIYNKYLVDYANPQGPFPTSAVPNKVVGSI